MTRDELMAWEADLHAREDRLDRLRDHLADNIARALETVSEAFPEGILIPPMGDLPERGLPKPRQPTRDDPAQGERVTSLH